MHHATARHERIKLLISEALEERLLPQHEARGALHLLLFIARRAFDLEAARGIRNSDAMTPQPVPDIGANRIAHIQVQIVIIHPELDLVLDAGVAKIVEEDL